MDQLTLRPGDALLLVDVQRDFLPGGALAVPRGDEVVPVLARYVRQFVERGLPVFASRDWHPPDHASFVAQGGDWPPHCVRDSAGADLASELSLPASLQLISKATDTECDAYSAFDGTDLHARLREQHVERLWVGGLATDYCVRHTVVDALRLGYRVVLLVDAIRAIDLQPGDGQRAIDEMVAAGATVGSSQDSEMQPAD